MCYGFNVVQIINLTTFCVRFQLLSAWTIWLVALYGNLVKLIENFWNSAYGEFWPKNSNFKLLIHFLWKNCQNITWNHFWFQKSSQEKKWNHFWFHKNYQNYNFAFEIPVNYPEVTNFRTWNFDEEVFEINLKYWNVVWNFWYRDCDFSIKTCCY